jgi:putative transposase
MGEYRKLTHVIYQCAYHIVWVPKYRYRIFEGVIKEHLEHDIRVLCGWRDVAVLELNVQSDHIHLVCSVPPKLSISEFMGLLKGKLAIKIFKS